MANPFPKAKTVHSVGDELMYFHMIQRGHGLASFPYATTHLFPGVVRVPGTPVRADSSPIFRSFCRRITTLIFLDFISLISS